MIAAVAPAGVLQTLDRATRMLAEVRTAQDAKQIADLAGAAEHFAKKAKLGQEAIDYAHAIKIDAQAMLGEFLKDAPKNTGAMGIGKKCSSAQAEHSVPRIPDLGLTHKESSTAQLLATVKREKPEVFDKIRNEQKPILQVKRELKESQREERRSENRQRVAETPSLQNLTSTFATIVIDPPWDFGDEGDFDQLGRGRPTYHQMPIDEIAGLPIGKLADVDAHLYLWITNRSLPKGFGLIERWGFRYITCLTWCKPSFGMGNYFRGSTEQILFAVRGSQLLKRKDVGTWFEAPRRSTEHSSKPIEFYGLVESCSPGPYLDVFGRIQRPDWTTWGAEA